MKHPTSFVLHWTAFEPHEMCGSPFISAKKTGDQRDFCIRHLNRQVPKERKINQKTLVLSGKLYMLKSQCWKVIKGYKRGSLSKWWKNIPRCHCHSLSSYSHRRAVLSPGTRFTSQRNYIVIQNTQGKGNCLQGISDQKIQLVGF